MSTMAHRQAILPEGLCSYTRSWARHGIYVGPTGGWRTVERYGACFPTLCLMGGAAAPQSPLPPDVRLTLVAASDVLQYRFSYGHPDAAKRGEVNAHFLDAGMFAAECPRLSAGAQGMVVLPVGHLYRTEEVRFDSVLTGLDRFLGALPGMHRYAVEMHNSEYLLPEYFDCLRRHRVAHVLNDHRRMPPLLDQVLLPHVFPAEHVVVRASARPDDGLQTGLIETVRRCVAGRKELFLYLEEEEEGMVPSFLMMLMGLLDKDLARLSPIRRKAA